MSALVALLEHPQDDVVRNALDAIGDLVFCSRCLIHPAMAAGLGPLLVKLLHHSDIDVVECAVWTLCSIAGESTHNIKDIVSAGAVPRLVALVRSRPSFFLHVALVLSYIAKDGPEHRDQLIDEGIIEALLTFVHQPYASVRSICSRLYCFVALIDLFLLAQISSLRHVTMIFVALSFHDAGNLPCVAALLQLIPPLAHLIKSNVDERILQFACICLSNLCNFPIKYQQAIEIVPRLVAFLYHPHIDVATAASNAVRNIINTYKYTRGTGFMRLRTLEDW